MNEDLSIDSYSALFAEGSKQGVRWLSQLQRQDGSYGLGIQSLKAYYKSPLAFALGGHSGNSERAISWLVRNHATPWGHFRETDQAESYLKLSPIYRDAWILWGLTSLGGPDLQGLALQVFGWIASHEAESGGGLGSGSPLGYSATYCDILSTSLGGLAAIWMNRADLASRAAGFVTRLVNDQRPFASGLWLRRGTDGSIIGSASGNEDTWYRIGWDQKEPLYYVPGFAIAFLAQAFRFAQNERYLDAGLTLFDFVMEDEARVLRHPYCGKIGWAGALLYRITGSKRFADAAISVGKYLLSKQLSDGSVFIHESYRDPGSQPLDFTLDRTAEYAAFLRLIAGELSYSSLVHLRR